MLPDFLQKYSNTEVDLIQRLGYVPMDVDSYGNAMLSLSNISVSSSLTTLSLENPIYIESQIETLYDVAFTEFTMETDKAYVNVEKESEIYKNLYNNVLQENETILNQLSASLSAIESTNKNKSDDQANRQVIVGLRIKMGEGTTESQFETHFPYLKIVDTSKT